MSMFSGIGHAIGGAFKGVDKVANKINPMHHIMDQAANVAGDVWKPLGKAGHWGNNHPAEAAALAATIYFGGSALMSGLGGGAGAAAGAAGGAAAGGTAMGGAAGVLGAADSAAASSALGLTAADVGGMGAAGAAGAGAGAGGWLSTLQTGEKYLGYLNNASKLLGGAKGGSGMAGGSGSGTDWSSVIGGLGSLYSGVQANHQAGGLQSILNDAYGFNSSRPEYAKELNALMANPEQAVTSSPGYKASMDQALQASQRTAAAQGLTGSGTEAAALAQTGANLESSTYDKLFSQLSMLSGAQLDPSHLFSGQMSVDQTKQGGSEGVFSGVSSMFGGGSSGGSGGGLGGWLSGLFGSSSGTGAGSGLTSQAGNIGSYLGSDNSLWSSYTGG